MGQFTVSNREYLLGNLLKKLLENTHYNKNKIDDIVSERAFELYLKKIDSRKQFLLASDIKDLRKYAKKFDDEMLTGKITSVDKAEGLIKKRIKTVQSYANEILKKPFDFNLDDAVETDYDKREFVKSEKSLKEFWRKLLKHSTMLELLKFEEEIKLEKELAKKAEEEKKKKKKDKKKDKPKKTAEARDKKKKPLAKMSFKEKEIEARENVAKDYRNYFKRLLREKHIDKISKFYNAVAQVYDPHTVYLPPDDNEDFHINMSGKLEGIGAVLSQDGPYTKVERIVPGSASWKQKELQVGDVIIKVGEGEKEPINIVDMDLRDAVKLIRGPKGTEVRLTIKTSDGNIKIIPILRDVVEIEETYARGVVIEHKKLKKKFGYISLPSFYRDFNSRSSDAKNCTDDVREILKKMNNKNVDGLVLDLRNNGGGSLHDAKTLSGLFIGKGPIVQVKDHEGNINVLRNLDKSVEFDKPLIVLVNQFSASAAEILAGAMQDYGRGLIVGGAHSYGKGTVQTIVDLDQALPSLFPKGEPLGALKITIQKFYRINGSSTQNIGVTPDIRFPDLIVGDIEIGERYLDYALPKGQINGLTYKPWTPAFDSNTLKVKSETRRSKNPKFVKLKQRLNWLEKESKKTNRSLNLAKYKKEKKRKEEMLEKYKMDEEIKEVSVSHFEGKKLPKERKASLEEFVERIKKDTYLEESLFILNDMVGQIFMANAKKK